MEVAGPFRILAQQIWIKADDREPPVAGEQFKPQTVQASSSDEGAQAANTINHKGLRDRDGDGLDEHSLNPTDMWCSAKGAGANWIEFDFGKVQSVDAIHLWNYNDQWLADRGVSKADISVWTQDTGWRKIRDDLPIERAQGSDDYDDPMIVKLDGVKAQKVRFDDLTSFGDPDYVGLSKVQFFDAPGPKAIRPKPYDGSDSAGIFNATLEWKPGHKASRHNVYFGPTPAQLKLMGTVESPSTHLSTLARGTTYYWRVDEIQADETVTPGSVWSFTTGRDVTGPKDVVVGVPDEGVTTDYSAIGWPPSELPRCATDDDTSTKYLHLAGEVQSTGFRTTPEVGPTVVTGLTFTTANDAEDRDPASWELYGSNESIQGPYKLIASGKIVDFSQPTAWPRNAKSTTPIAFKNDTAYKHYQVMFPTVRNPDRANSMQVTEVELLGEQSQATRFDPALVKLVQPTVENTCRLTAWWKLDETTGTAVTDSSGNGHHGQIRGNPTWLPTGGHVGGALQFDGADDFVDTGWRPNLRAWTVALWVKSPVAPTSPVASGPVHCERNFQINWNHGDEAWQGAAGACIGGVWYAVSFGDLKGDTWYHLVATYDGKDLKAYTDGVLVSNNADPSGDPEPEPETLKLGRHATTDDAFFAGVIDEVCIFDNALDADSVKALCSGKEPPAIAGSQPTVQGESLARAQSGK